MRAHTGWSAEAGQDPQCTLHLRKSIKVSNVFTLAAEMTWFLGCKSQVPSIRKSVSYIPFECMTKGIQTGKLLKGCGNAGGMAYRRPQAHQRVP